MFAIPQEIHTDAASKRILLGNPIVWLLSVLALIHLATFIPSILAQREYKAKDQEFKELWNTGGSMSLAAQGIEPSRNEELARREAYLRTFVAQSFFYNVWMVPHWTNGISIFTAWILEPGWLSFLWAAFVLLYFGLWIPQRLSGLLPLFLIIGYSMAGTFAYYLLVGILMGKHGELPFCGISMAAAASLGLLIRSHAKDIPIRFYWAEWKTKMLHPYLFVAICIVLDFLIQVVVNPINYGWVFVLDLASVGIGYALALRLPAPILRTKTSAQPGSADALAPIRQRLNEGWRLSDMLELEAALGELEQGLKMLLRNPKPDAHLVEQTFQRILVTKHPLPVSPQLWYEWGVRLAEISFPAYAIQCLENAVKSPSATISMARPAVVQAAELRIQHQIQPADAIPWLQRVIKARPDDLLGRKASQLLESIST